MVTDTSVNVYNRINKVYQANAFYLDGTGADTAVTTYLAIDDPDRADLNTLRQSLNTYKNALSTTQVNIYAATNTLLMATENEFIFDQIGSTTLSTNFKTEDANGITFASIITALGAAIGTTTTTNALMSAAMADAITGSESSENGVLQSALETAMDAVSGGLNSDAKVAAYQGVVLAAANNAAAIAAAVYDATYLTDSGSDATDFATATTTYEVSDNLVTATSAIGTSDISSVGSADNTLTATIGNTALDQTTLLGVSSTLGADITANLANINSALDTAIGTTTIAAVATGSDTIAGVIGNTALDGVNLLSVASTVGADITANLANINAALDVAIGVDSIAAVATAGNTISKVIGNTALADIDLLGVNTAASADMSSNIATINAAIETAIGDTIITRTNAFAGKACDSASAIGSGATIFTTSLDISTTIKNMFLCAEWATGTGDLYFSTDGTDGGCTGLLNSGQAFATCMEGLYYTA